MHRSPRRRQVVALGALSRSMGNVVVLATLGVRPVVAEAHVLTAILTTRSAFKGRTGCRRSHRGDDQRALALHLTSRLADRGQIECHIPKINIAVPISFGQIIHAMWFRS